MTRIVSLVTVLISIKQFHGLFSDEANYISFLSDDNKDRKYYKDGVTGVLESVSIYEGKFGNQISMNIKNGDDVYYVPVDIADQKGNVDTYDESLIKLLPQLNKGINKIPAPLKSADYNGDNYISAEEITKTIDSFFDGTNDFTVDKINQLIDFFFEQ